MKTFLCISFVFLLANSTMAQTKKIIFVCEHGAAKSVIASAYFNKLAKDRHLDYMAECRGTNPDNEVSAKAKEGLTADHVYDNKTKPKKLVIDDTFKAERMILFTSLPPNFKTNVPTEDWSGLENLDGDYTERRDAIVKQINTLLDTLEKTKLKQP
jgi:arsenate reductase